MQNIHKQNTQNKKNEGDWIIMKRFIIKLLQKIDFPQYPILDDTDGGYSIHMVKIWPSQIM